MENCLAPIVWAWALPKLPYCPLTSNFATSDLVCRTQDSQWDSLWVFYEQMWDQGCCLYSAELLLDLGPAGVELWEDLGVFLARLTYGGVIGSMRGQP